MLKTLARLKALLAGLANDPRIPARDKKALLAFAVYLAMPFDLIPDFIPVLGYADDLVVAVIVLDYLFNVIPEPVVLEHFPWDPERYRAIRRRVRLVSWMIPGFVRRRLWKAAQVTP